jgi:transposase
VEDRARLVNRLQKVLEETNLKLASVVTDITGVTARSILHALLDGQTDPQVLSSLARGRLCQKKEQLVEALQGTLKEHHRFLLKNQLQHLELLDNQIAQFDREIAALLHIDQTDGCQEESQEAENVEGTSHDKRVPVPSTDDHSSFPSLQGYDGYAQALSLLDGVPGINTRIAHIIVAERGIDMRRFPDEMHLVSWAGLCPGAKISAGKRLSGKISKGNQWLRQALIEAAHGAARSKGTYIGALYQRFAKRLGRKKAIIALAHRILIIVYHLLKKKEPYHEYGEAYVQQQEQETIKLQAIRRLECLGYEVSLEASSIA